MVAELREIAAEAGAEMWIACRTHRDGPQPRPGHLPPPAEPFEVLVDLAFFLEPEDAKVRLRVLKDRDQMIDENLSLLLDQQTMLLKTGLGGKK